MTLERTFLDQEITRQLNARTRTQPPHHLAREAKVTVRDVHLACAGEPLYADAARRLSDRFGVRR